MTPFAFNIRHLCLALALGLSACATVVPPLPSTAPRIETPDRFDDPDMLKAENLNFDPEVANWWADFEDPFITSLINQALGHNKSIAAAQANINTAQALLRAQTLSGEISTQSIGGLDLGRGSGQGGNPNLAASGSLAANWENDRFGRIAALIRRADFDVKTAQEARRDIAVTIAAETAAAYIDLRGSQTRLGVAQSNVEIQREGLDLLTTLFDNGRANKLDTERAQSQFRTTLAALPPLEADIRNAASRLTALTGQSFRNDEDIISKALSEPGMIPQLQKPLLTGAPEEMIRRRPDIRAAEAEIGALLSLSEAERARLFPVITLGADISAVFRDGISIGDSLGFGLGPSIRWEGPDLRQVYADIDVADARTRAAVTRYEAAVITALSEAEIALTNYRQERARQSDLIAAAESADRAVELARLRFEEGLDDYLDVIDAQRTLLITQDTLERSRLEIARRAIAAYRTLGGIWNTERLDAMMHAEEGQDQ